LDAVKACGKIPSSDAPQSVKKRYSEKLSRNLAVEMAEGLRRVGFPRVKPEREGPQEKEFQGGLGPKKVDVTYSDEQHGLIFAVSIKTITAPPFGKNLKNRFGDLCTEAITLHMRFPYSVICSLFAFPSTADQDHSAIPGRRQVSTFQRATQLFATISGRREYTDPGEKFENVTMMLFQPVLEDDSEPSLKLFDTLTKEQLTEQQYFSRLLDLHNRRNPHALIEELEAILEDANEDQESPETDDDSEEQSD
jgi:hypothetical protein